MKPRLCTFYSSYGFCADGECCEYLHEYCGPFQPSSVKTPQCAFFASAGGCKYGDVCRYSHIPDPNNTVSYAAVVGAASNDQDIVVSSEDSIPACKFFLSGSCVYGSRCRYRHDKENGIETSVKSDLECGICMAMIDGCQLGMMSHCNCLFCLNCIRNWRKDGLEISGPSQVRSVSFGVS